MVGRGRSHINREAKKKFDNNFDAIFGSKTKQSPEDKKGNKAQSKNKNTRIKNKK